MSPGQRQRHRASSQVLHRGFLSGQQKGLLSGSAQSASSRTRHRSPPLRLDKEGLLSGSAQRASLRAPNIWPPLGHGRGPLLRLDKLDTEGHRARHIGPLGSAHRASCQARHIKPPLSFCICTGASSRVRHRGPPGSVEDLLAL